MQRKNVTHILLIKLETMIPFQTKRKRVVIFYLFCISEAAHFPQKNLLEKRRTKSDQNIFFNI